MICFLQNNHHPVDVPNNVVRDSDSKTALFVFWLLSILALLSHLVSMMSIPVPWMDGVHIHELGRIFLSGTSSEKSVMVNPDGTNAVTFYYVGPILQEFMYQLFGFAGPRLSPILGLLIAAFFCRAWLLKKGNSPWLSTLLALMVLTNPALTQSVRFVRIDTWNFALFFAIVYLMECAAGQTRHIMRRYFFIAGALTGLSLFVWPTSFVFIFYYIANLWTSRMRNYTPLSEILKLYFSAAIGLCIIIFLIALPLLSQLDMILNYLSFPLSRSKIGNEVNIAYSLWANTKVAGVCFLREILRDPFFMATVAIGVLSRVKRLRNDVAWVICGFVALGACAATGLYIYRYIYLLPFMFMLAKTGLQAIQKNHTKTATALAVSLLCYGFLTSFLAPLTMACIYRGRSIYDITTRLRSVIGEGEKRVYVCSFQTYYPARMLGWHFYRYTVGHFLFEDSKYANLLSRVDYVIDKLPLPCEQVLEEGFTLYNVIRDYSMRSAIDLSKNSDLTTRCAADLNYRIKTFFAGLGGSLVYVPNCEAGYVQTEKYFVSQGFEKVCVLSFAPDDSVYSPFERWLLSKQIVNPNYDPLVIWRRSAKPDNCPDQNHQAR